MKVSSSDDFSVGSPTLETDLSLSVSSWASDTVGPLSFPGRTRIGTVGSPFFPAGEVTSSIFLQVLLNSAALLVSCKAARAHTLLGQSHYACTDPMAYIRSCAQIGRGPIALSKWLSLLCLCMPIWLATMYCYAGAAEQVRQTRQVPDQ